MSPAADVYFSGIYDMRFSILVLIYYEIMLVGAMCSEMSIIVLVYITFFNIHMLSNMMIFEIDDLQQLLKQNKNTVHTTLVDNFYMEKLYNKFTCAHKVSVLN